MKRLLEFAVCILLLIGAAPGFAQEEGTFVLRGANVFDGVSFIGPRDVLVVDGLIAAVVAPQLPAGIVPAGTLELEAGCCTLLPGLVDAHTHSFGEARTLALRFGVTAVVDMFGDPAAIPAAKRDRESLSPVSQADMWSAGIMVTVAGGHGTQFVEIPTITGADIEIEGVEEFVSDRVTEGSDFIKIALEPGSEKHSLPTLSPGQVAAAIAAAHHNGKLAVVHVSSLAAGMTAVEMGADGLAHLFGDAVLSPPQVEAIAQSGAFVVPTLAVLESISGRASGLEKDPRIAFRLSPSQRGSLLRPFAPAAWRANIISFATENLRLLHAAGVTILAGSDAPNPGTTHGASLHRELELLVKAGLSPGEALAAGTSRPAFHFGITGRGRIGPGMRADLVLVVGNPDDDITATRNIVAVWKNGYRTWPLPP